MGFLAGLAWGIALGCAAAEIIRSRPAEELVGRLLDRARGRWQRWLS